MKHAHPHSPTAGWLIGSLTAFMLALTACGGSDDAPPDPLQPYRNQALQWSDCPATITGEDLDGTQTLYKAQCTTMRAPMNYAAPEDGEVQIAVLRVPALTSQRKGAVLFNPGGPGADGQVLAFLFHSLVSQSNPTNPLGALQLRLIKEYDMVGFAPRGVAPSTVLKCSSDEKYLEVDDTAEGRAIAANVDAIFTNTRHEAEACRQNPLAPFITTDATARDMDLLRGLLGDERLNYIGYSYGTWLGAWYAKLFPERVDRMVLDSNADFSNAYMNFSELQPGARQRLLDEVMAPYAARHADFFQLGSSADEVRAVLASLHPVVRATTFAPLATASYKNTAANAFLLNITAARGLDETLKALPGASPEAVQAVLKTQVFTPIDAATNAEVQELALALHESYLDAIEIVPGTLTQRTIEVDSPVYNAITCNDSAPASTDPAYWRALGDRLLAQSPLFGAHSAYPPTRPCLYWGGPSVSHPPIAAMQGLDVLMVQSEYDAATPTSGATRAAAALPEARIVFVPGEYTHGVFPYNDQCVDSLVIRYLLGETPAARQLDCPAQPLALDRMEQKQGSSASATYTDPELASHRVRQFKERIGRH